jgi:hypothetical protein
MACSSGANDPDDLIGSDVCPSCDRSRSMADRRRTRIIGDVGCIAVLTLFDKAAKRGRPACRDGTHDAPLHATEMAGVGVPKSFAVAAEYIRHLEAHRHGGRSAGLCHSYLRRVTMASKTRLGSCPASNLQKKITDAKFWPIGSRDSRTGRRGGIHCDWPRGGPKNLGPSHRHAQHAYLRPFL